MDEQRSKNVKAVRRRSKKGPGREGGASAFVLEVKELVTFLKKEKVEHFKSEHIELKFSLMAHLPEIKKNPEPREEDLLYYSAGDRPA
jgi:hypothetical protein